MEAIECEHQKKGASRGSMIHFVLSTPTKASGGYVRSV